MFLRWCIHSFKFYNFKISFILKNKDETFLIVNSCLKRQQINRPEINIETHKFIRKTRQKYSLSEIFRCYFSYCEKKNVETLNFQNYVATGKVQQTKTL